MSTIAATVRPIPFPTMDRLRRDPAAQAFLLLRIAFVVAPILFGLDKFAEVMNDNWTAYLSSEFNDLIPGSAEDAMYAVGAVEIVAGLVVLVSPRFGGLLVAGWLGGIIVNLLLVGGYGDIALRDFGLLLGALTLSLLASAFTADAPQRGRGAGARDE
jgi:DoxX